MSAERVFVLPEQDQVDDGVVAEESVADRLQVMPPVIACEVFRISAEISPPQFPCYQRTKPASTSSLLVFPTKRSTSASAKSIAVPGPREVMSLPSSTTA